MSQCRFQPSADTPHSRRWPALYCVGSNDGMLKTVPRVLSRNAPNAQAHLPGPLRWLRTPRNECAGRVRCSAWLGSGEILTPLIVVLTSRSSRNEPGNAGLHNGIESDPRLDPFADLP